MEFQPIIPTKPGDNQVTIALTKQGTSITIPGRVAEEAGLQGKARVGLAYGAEGRKRCIRISAKDDGGFKFTQRQSSFYIISKELNPSREIEGKKPVTYDVTPDGLVITLPTDWQIAANVAGAAK